MLFGATMETDTSAFSVSLCACRYQKILHSSMCLNSWLQYSGRKQLLRAQQRKASQTLFNCNDEDVAPDLCSEYELGGSCSAREAGYWRKKEEKAESGKGLRQKERGGGLRIFTQQWGHIHTDIYIGKKSRSNKSVTRMVTENLHSSAL